MKNVYFFCLIILFCLSCRDGNTPKESQALTSRESFSLLSQEDCPIRTLRITLEGVIEEEMVALDRESPLRYEKMKCEGQFFLKLGSKKILLDKSLFSSSDLSLKKNVIELDNLNLKTSDIEEIILEKEGLCIKNYESKKPCKDRNKGEQCLFYDSYEEEIYKVSFLSIEADGVEIYNADLDLVFNRDYELKWSDSDLLSAFWTKLHNCSR